MIDWNNDGRVDPTEVVLTDIILSEDTEPDEEPDVPFEDEIPDKPESWLVKLFHRRRRLGK